MINLYKAVSTRYWKLNKPNFLEDPANTIHWPDVKLMFVHCVWCWPNIRSALVQCFMFTIMRRSPIVGPMLARCLRHWPHILPTLAERLVLAGYKPLQAGFQSWSDRRSLWHGSMLADWPSVHLQSYCVLKLLHAFLSPQHLKVIS